VVEGASGNRAALFNVMLSEPAASPVSIHYATADRTALAGSDYVAHAGTLVFSGASTSAKIAVKVKGDRNSEADERFSVNLARAVGATLTNATGSGTIADDDPSGAGRVATLGWTDRTPVFARSARLKIPVSLSAPAVATVQLNLRASCHPMAGCTRTPGPTVSLKPGQTERTLTFIIDPAVAARGSITMALKGGTVAVDPTLVTSRWDRAITSGLVINEVDYDNVGRDTTEFVELFNDGATAASLDGLALVFANGTNGDEYRRVALSGSLSASGYLVVADQAVTVADGARVVRFSVTHDNVQNGAPDGIALVDTNDLRVLDAVSYEGAITQAHLAGFADPVSLVEGTPTDAADPNTTQGGMARMPNGTDTDNADHDWAVVAAPSPGAANHT